MMIIVSGATGAGKTYLTTKKFVIKKWFKGENITSNIHLYVDRYRRWGKKPKNSGQYTLFEQIEDTYHLENQVVLFDDAGKVFNSKRWAEISLEFADKLQTHRHDHLTFFATTPSIKRIYNEFRQLTHHWFFCEKVFGIGNEYFNLFSLHRYRELNIDDIETVDDDKLARPLTRNKYFFIWYGSKRYYDTHAKIKNQKYKQIWTTINDRRILVIQPNTMSLKEGMSLWQSLKNGYTQNRRK